jgi:hypothetical protein
MHKLFTLLLAILTVFPSIAFGFDAPMTIETIILEHINTARANPWAEAWRLGLDPTSVEATLPPETVANLDQGLTPVVGNYRLNAAAAVHSQYMIDHNRYTAVTDDGQTPESRVAAADYSAILVRQEIGAMAFEFFINAEEAAPKILDSLLKRTFKNQLTGSGSALFDSQVQEVGVSLRTGTISFFGRTFNMVALSIVFAKPIDGDERSVQCGHLYDDKNLNGLFDQGEGIANEQITILPDAGGLFPVLTGTDGSYCFLQPKGHHWLLNICKELFAQYDYYQIDESPETVETIDIDYNGLDFSCEAGSL